MKGQSRTAHRHRRIVLAACVVLWAGALIATHTPPGRLPRVGVSDKFLHVLGYFALSAMLWLTLRCHDARGKRRWAIVFLATLAYAALDESTQPLVGRNASFGDWAADALGALIALLVCELLVRRLKTRDKPRAPQAP